MIRTMSISKLQLCLAGSLTWQTVNKMIATVTRYRRPSHVIIPVACLTPEMLALLPPELLTPGHLTLAEEIAL